MSRSECHARGFIPFCQENNEFNIERHIGLFSNLLPEEDFGSAGPYLDIEHWFGVLISWMEEALLLSSEGMPAGSFTLVLDGATQASAEVWKVFKFAAASQQARLQQRQLMGLSLPRRPLRPLYEGVWDLPADFAKSIRDIVEDHSVIQYDEDVGELWDDEIFCLERKAWTEDQWYHDWADNVIDVEIVVPPGFWPSVTKRYTLY